MVSDKHLGEGKRLACHWRASVPLALTTWKVIFREDKHPCLSSAGKRPAWPGNLEGCLPGSFVPNVISLTPFWAGSS